MHENAAYEDVQPFLEEAKRVVETARERDVTLRVLGAIAFYMQCPEYNWIQRETKRLYTDIDYAAYSSQQKQVEKLFADLGYEEDVSLKVVPGVKRAIFHSRTQPWHSDVFYDELDFSHRIELKGRLDLDERTLSLVDLLLEKMQIAQLNEKDAIDTAMLLREHDVGLPGPGVIDAEYLAHLMKSDWGFWRTLTENLDKVRSLIDGYAALSDSDRQDIRDKIARMLDRVESEPPTTRWKLRAKIGERKKWYRDVDEVF